MSSGGIARLFYPNNVLLYIIYLYIIIYLYNIPMILAKMLSIFFPI